MFLGTHSPRLDEKGRIFLPAKYRNDLAGGVVITKGQERCLYVFPPAEFERITEALRTAPVTAKAVRVVAWPAIGARPGLHPRDMRAVCGPPGAGEVASAGRSPGRGWRPRRARWCRSRHQSQNAGQHLL